MKKIAFVALLSAFAATPVFAGDDEGPYVGVNIGSSDVGGNAMGWGLYGGYVIDPSVTSISKYMEKLSFGGEVEYTSLGSNSTWLPSATYATYKATAFGVVLTATYLINSQFSVTAKAGVGSTTYELSCGCPSGFNNSTVDWRYGAAGQYNLTEQIGIRVGIDAYPDKFTQMSAGAVFKF